MNRHDSIHEMARHLPPGGATLTVLDLSPTSIATELTSYRPDLRIVRTDMSSVAADSLDAIMALNFLPKDRAAFLKDCLRALRPGGRLILLDLPKHSFWPRQQIVLEHISAILTGAGFARVLAEHIPNGILSRGEKPYTALSTVERIAQTAAVDETNVELRVIDASDLESASRGKFVFLLVRQTPDKPAWAIQSGETLRWQAAMVNDPQGQPFLLAFASLSKAVEFMQSAVTTGYLHGINKVAKFDKAVAPRWSSELLLNPPFETLRASAQYLMQGVSLDVDPASAVTGEE